MLADGPIFVLVSTWTCVKVNALVLRVRPPNAPLFTAPSASSEAESRLGGPCLSLVLLGVVFLPPTT